MSDDNVVPLRVRGRKPEERSLCVVDVYDPGKCDHTTWGNTYIVDEHAGTVECGKCHKQLSPIWVLLQLQRQESYWMRSRTDMLEVLAKLDKRKRTKCRKCGEMTEIRL